MFRLEHQQAYAAIVMRYGPLLVPVTQYPVELPDMQVWEATLDHTWLLVVDGHPSRFAMNANPKPNVEVLHGGSTNNTNVRSAVYTGSGPHGRWLKWCLTYSGHVDHPRTNIKHFHIERLEGAMLEGPDLIRRLEDERDAFRRTLHEHCV